MFLYVVFCISCLQLYTGASHVRPMHPSVGSSGLGTSCSPSPPKSVLSQSAPADVNAFTLLHRDIDAADSVSHMRVKRQLFCTKSTFVVTVILTNCWQSELQWRHQLWGTCPSLTQNVYGYAYKLHSYNYVYVQHQDISSTCKREGQLETPHFLAAKSLEVIYDWL